MEILEYDGSLAGAWDELVAGSAMGTFLHTRRFLGYHGDRFEDVSVVVLGEDGVALGVLPAAVDPADPARVVSHPGATFGGLVHDGSLRGSAMLEALRSIAAHYAGRGFSHLRYAAVPHIYHRQPSGDDLYALFRLGAERPRADLSCAIDLEDGASLSSRRRRGLNKARRSGVEVVDGPGLVDELWPVVEENLAERHRARPVHTAAEMRILVELFPEEIRIVVAREAGEPVGGAVFFRSARVLHTQYSVATSRGHEIGALDAVLSHWIDRATADGLRFFDFGTSNADEGTVLNEGLFTYKAQFGGGGVAHGFYELDLGPRPAA